MKLENSTNTKRNRIITLDHRRDLSKRSGLVIARNDDLHRWGRLRSDNVVFSFVRPGRTSGGPPAS